MTGLRDTSDAAIEAQMQVLERRSDQSGSDSTSRKRFEPSMRSGIPYRPRHLEFQTLINLTRYHNLKVATPVENEVSLALRRGSNATLNILCIHDGVRKCPMALLHRLTNCAAVSTQQLRHGLPCPTSCKGVLLTMVSSRMALSSSVAATVSSTRA